MLGTQVQKVSVTFCPDAAADELPAAAVVPAPADVLAGVPDAGGVELPDEEQPAAESTASAALASARPAVPVARLRRRWGVDFMVPPR
jgi:hypothetical protein